MGRGLGIKILPEIILKIQYLVSENVKKAQNLRGAGGGGGRGAKTGQNGQKTPEKPQKTALIRLTLGSGSYIIVKRVQKVRMG